jgi:hypothetical protein
MWEILRDTLEYSVRELREEEAGASGEIEKHQIASEKPDELDRAVGVRRDQIPRP